LAAASTTQAQQQLQTVAVLVRWYPRSVGEESLT
jgi:hypothetical protein